MWDAIIDLGKEITSQNYLQEVEISPMLADGEKYLVCSFDFGWQRRAIGFT